MVATLPSETQILPFLPWWAERACLLFSGVWLVNVVNFMDGIDWITVAEVVPVTGAIVLLGLFGVVGLLPAIVAAALFGASLGFAPFNRPVAKLFLGDVGSLPIGLLVGWILLQVAWTGHFVAALLLPLYYLADATLTLLRRVATGDPFWIAHRSHYYQRATDNGFTVVQVVSRVFVLNLVLVALALTSLVLDTEATTIACVVVGTLAVVFLMWRFSKPR
jgi:UDP-N-acetylmuramyl pentapeptide phosphotransferase/UDP-N-acetylglucosamine-1-phosphate transferase